MKKSKPRNVGSLIKRATNLVALLVVTLSPVLPPNMPARAVAQTISSLPALASLSLEGVQRVLVISPHPDDETIAPGGLIQAALANGAQVRVVIFTNGDGQFFAPLLFGLDGGPLPAGYVSMGATRMAESTAALETLGLPAEDIAFLGYPDRGLQPMLEKNWPATDPYTAPFTRTNSSPYSGTPHPGAAYCGESLFSDLRSLVLDYRPDLIVLPHPADQHSDHAAASTFTIRVIATIRLTDSAYRPRMWAYLVHYGKYPLMDGVDRSLGFFPPADLVTSQNTWGSLTLTSQQVQGKSAAIKDYPTQVLLLGNFLPEFTRINELFMILPVESGRSRTMAALSIDFKNPEAQ
jgi:LmbE family N-acetylglucosaminyl deacetylase